MSYLHNRFVKCSRHSLVLSRRVPGKFTGAVGTSASQRALIKSHVAEDAIMEMLKLPTAEITTQITPPEPTARYYHELTLMSGALMNLCDDIRFLQSSPVGEVMTPSSSSSAMPHKEGNPIAAENVAGMHVSVLTSEIKVLLTLGSNLQRDLRWSNVMRSYASAMVFLFQQLNTTLRILTSLKVKVEHCRENFDRDGKLLVGELLHLALQVNGYPESHKFVNEVIVPAAIKSGQHLDTEVEKIAADGKNELLQKIWPLVPDKVKHFLRHPEEYLGDAVIISRREANNGLRKSA